MKKTTLLSVMASLFLVGSLTSCKKYKDNLTIPPTQSKFNTITGTYFVTNSPTSSFSIPVSLTAVSSSPVTVSVTVTSPTGAAAGAQYNLPSSSITIPAGKLVDTLKINGIFAGFPGTRRDTLVITLSGGNVPVMVNNSTYRLVMTKACDVVFTALAGNYTRTNEYNGGAFSYGPYTTILKNFVATGPTTATAQIQNLYDDGWNDITVQLNYTDPANYTVTIPLQATGKSYNGGATSVRTTTGRVNTFSSCNQTFGFFIDLVNPGNVVIASGYEFRIAR